jgi:hypothetical protein
VLAVALVGARCGSPRPTEIAPAGPEPIPGQHVERFSPEIEALYPPDAYAGTPFATNFEGVSVLGVAGRQFSPGSVVYFDGSPLLTQFISSQALTATVPADRIARPGALPVIVEDPYGTRSPAATLSVRPPRTAGACPQIRELFPPEAKAGAAFGVRPNGNSSLGVAGVDFGPRTVVWFDGIQLQTIYQGPGSLIGIVPASMLARPRRAPVVLDEPGCARSAKPLIFTVR